MANTPKTRGSVLLMVVGLLTMIAMLGGTFVVIAYLDAKSTAAMVAKVQADPLAKGLATQVIAMLAEKLDIEDDAKGPYSSNSSIKPHLAIHASDQLGPYLYSYDPDANPVIRHPSAVDGGGDASTEVNIDNDPGDIKDGYLHESKTMNANGDKYWTAVAVKDLGGLINVNTAGNKTELLDPVSPVNVNLLNALSAIHPDGGTYYSKVHSARCGTGGTSMQNLHNNLATRLLNPQSGTKPFAIDDELYLRWRKTPSITETGRLYDALKSFSACQYLATYNCMRSLVRHPNLAANYLKRIKMSGTCLDAQTLRDYLLNQLMLARTGGSGGSGGGGGDAGDEIIIDDGDPESAFSGNWISYSYGPCVGGDMHYIRTAGSASARYTFTIPEANSDCDVFITWISNSNRHLNAPWAIYDGSNPTPVASGTLNMRNPPSGGLWESLAKPKITSTTCIVELAFSNAGRSSQVIADAVRVVPYPPVTESPSSGPEPAHFLANLWASLKTPAQAAGMAFKVTYADADSGGNKSVYGIVNQPFIVETYAQHETNGKTDDYKYRFGFAMRLMNPYKHEISLANYKIQGCGDDITLSGTIPAGGSKILWDMGGTANHAKRTDFKFDGAGTWQQATGLRFWKGKTVKLVRVVGGEQIPIDSVVVSATGDLKFTAVENDISAAPSTDEAEKTVKKGARRDDSLIRGRYSVAIHHHTTEEDHKLNESTGVGVTIPIGTGAGQILPGFHVEIPHAGDWAKSPADLAKIYQVGPTADGSDLPHILANLTAEMKTSRGRANFLGDAPPGPSAYPDVPWATLVGEIFEFAQTDTSRPADDPLGTRVYGRVNINTAPTMVLRYLPWPSGPTGPIGIKVTDAVDGTETTFLATIDVNAIVTYIVDYRENRGTHNRGSMGVGKLRTGTNYPGFMTPGELAIPLAKYFDDNVAANLKNHKLYMEARDKLYRAVSNVISVNSDVFAINILVQLGNPAKYKWYYIAIVDRSNCRRKEDRPVVLLFSQVY